MILATQLNRPVVGYLSRPQRREFGDLNEGEILTSGGCQRGMFCVLDGVMSVCFGQP